MTVLLIIGLGAVFAFGAYLAAQVTRRTVDAGDHLDGSGSIPAWAYIFASAGVVLSALALHDHFRLLSVYGFQANGLGLALVLVAMVSALFHKRLGLAAGALGRRTLGGLLGTYFGSPSIRIYLLLLLFLFSVALPASLLSGAGDLLATASGGEIPRPLAIAGIGFFLFLISAIGGWRAVIYLCAGLSFLVCLLMLVLSGYSAAVFGRLEVLAGGFRTAQGILAGDIPGVIQFTRGFGLEVPAGGIWTTVAIGSWAVALAGIAFSPGKVFLGLTSKVPRALAFSQVWMVAGLGAGLLLLFGPVLAAELSVTATAGNPFAGLADRLAAVEPLAGVAFLLLLVSSQLIAIAFFASSGASIVTIELVAPYVLPGLSRHGERLAARIALAAIYVLAIMGAALMPQLSAVLASLSFSLAAQLFMALLGLCWVPWLSRQAVITGLIMGLIIVFFTEPPGLVLFSGLFVELPWGRWPLTIHSAAWGLFFNIGICLLAAIFTRKGTEREAREHAHLKSFAKDRPNFGGRGARGAKWSLVMLWAFFALGPGAILGNTFFSQPVFSGTTVTLGVPSLWVWQITFWVIGVMLVWWLAYGSRLSLVDAGMMPPVPAHHEAALRAPRWIDLFVKRIARRDRAGTRS